MYFAFRTLTSSLIMGFISGALLVLPAQAQSGKFERPMAEDPAVAVWAYNPQGELTVAAMIENVQGRVAVCGFWAITKRLSPYIKETGLDRKTRGNANVVVDGTVVMYSLRTFKRVQKEGLLIGAPASCRITSHPWRSSYSNKDVVIRTPGTTALN